MTEKEMTVQSLFDGLEKWNAAMARIVLRDKNDEPFRAVIVVDGRREVADVIAALDSLEEQWEAAANA